MRDCRDEKEPPVKCYPYDGRTQSGRKPTFPPNLKIVPGRTHFMNPGNVEDLHKRARDVMPVWLEGVQLNLKKSVGNSMTLKNTWVLSHDTPSGFRLGGTYYVKSMRNVLRSPFIEIDVNPSTLSTNFYYLHHPVPNLRLEAKVQTGPSSDGTSNSFSNYTAECTGRDWTTTVNIHNPRPDSGRVTVAMLRNIHPRICLGFECLSEWCKGQSQTLQPALAARYSSNNFALAATLSKEALDITCWRKLDHTVQLASSLIINQRTHHAVGAICYQWLFRNTCIKGMLHSDWSVGFNYTRKLENIAANLGFSLLFCIPNNKFCCGIKFDLDSNLQ